MDERDPHRGPRLTAAARTTPRLPSRRCTGSGRSSRRA
jgi:hypothetical protein